ncbi:acyl-ACP--UDP-N- acetylglucosamine O-acyltransferase [Lentzea jiangxiensis]|uniref:UDP-N-acetylglucosamine acyltransferase n=1 Tax=Lentzea jiangxiensis TaxID=641025 RepID=A0A1H0VC08_9PSEU|nr:acyl-ACP--UDP-N- acetylglucosamine O-acyltransferase [Lentzea jiangxiensis]SDP75997.1 UDP-N-acetylglucosamine acyltransferase [Lentzea jiangxiensis]
MVNHIHPSAVVGDGVELGDGITIGPGAVVLGPCVVEDGAWIGPGCVIGTPPEITSAEHNRAWDGELAHAGVHIGARAVVRELSTVHQGSYRATTVGADSWLLNRVYVAHDSLVGSGVTLSAGVSLGGHVQIGDKVNVGMNASVHQRRVIGAGAMVGMGTPVSKDVPPFARAYGSPVRVHGVNSVGMSRSGISDAAIEALTSAYAAGQLPGEIPAELELAFRWWTEVDPQKPLVG